MLTTYRKPFAGSFSPDETISHRLDDLVGQLGCDYVGPVAGRDLSSLVDVLDRIKRDGRPTLLHLQTSTSNRGAARPVDVVAPTEPSVEAREVGVAESLRNFASQELATLARRDERIALVSTSATAEFVRPWEALGERLFPVGADAPSALRWSASLAASGIRPFVFLSWEEAQNGFGPIRQDICLRGAAVTLIIEARDEANLNTPFSSAGLAGIRQLPNVSLLSPKDALELRQMLSWCASQSAPAVVSLPQDYDSKWAWTSGAEVTGGRAQQLSEGVDVAIVAWGPMVEAAALAADRLAVEGIRAAVVNARFAQPLDVETIGRVVRGALCAVIVSDAEEQGGFGGWVLERLLALGITQPVSIVAPPERASRQRPHEAQELCARTLVERCRWLAAPIVPDVTIEPAAPPVELKSAPDKWLEFRSTRADSMADERAQVYARQLSSDVWRWVRAYEKVGSRDLYLWKWCMHGVALTTLPCVEPELRAHVCDTKLLSIVLCVLLDDVADQHGDGRLLEALLEMTCTGASRSLRGLSAAAKRHAEVTRHVWSEYQARIATYPRRATFEPVLRFDLLQFFNTMRYSHLVNSRPYLLNMAEHDLYTSHNMMMVSFSTLDLMCSPDFSTAEVGLLREAMWHAQCMGRIGNLLSTWRRELVDRDFTSGLFARAVMEGDLTLDELEHGNLSKIESTIRLRGHESHFYRKWMDHRELCHARARRIRSYDMQNVMDGHDRFFAMHMGSQGLI